MITRSVRRVGGVVATLSLLILAGGAVASGKVPKGKEYLYPTNEDVQTFSRPAQVPQGENNENNTAREQLGKHLFFDPRLSGNNAMSCASCHNPALGWSDAQPRAIGHNMQVLERATPTIINTAYQTVQFWDGRAKTLEEQALGPIVAEGEMNQSMDELMEELQAVPGYVEMFEAAYPGEGIKPDTVGKAIAAFERTVIAGESKFDRWLQGEHEAMTEEERWGFLVFKGKGNCTACHSGHNFTDDKFHNVGLKGVTNPGRFAIDPDIKLKGAFKTPTLRDIGRTAPYMHNGAYMTLEEVVDHYDQGGFENAGTPSENMKPSLNLTERDKRALVAFMKALDGKQISVEIPVLPVK